MNTAQNYPQIFYPIGIEDVNISLLVPPISPIPPKEKAIEKRILYGHFFLVIIGFIVIIQLPNTPVFLWICLAISLIWFLFENIQQNSLAKKNEVIEKKKNNYQHELDNYNKKKIDQQNQSKLEGFRQKKIYKILAKSSNLKISDSISKSGISEGNFVRELKKHFPSLILTNKVVGNSFNNCIYYPDIILEDSDYQIRIDIEIDEPYTLKDETPIHYIQNGKSIDFERNVFFQKEGWIVIRFSEEQVEKEPLGCCKFIAKAILDLKGITDLGSKYSDINNIFKVRCWTKEEALQMANARFRNTYLYLLKENNNKTLNEELNEYGFQKGVQHHKDGKSLLKDLEILKKHGYRINKF